MIIWVTSFALGLRLGHGVEFVTGTEPNDILGELFASKLGGGSCWPRRS